MTTPTTVNVRLQLRADTAANWTAANPILLANEVGLETDTKKLKVGNGSTAWNSLAYFPSIVSGGTVLGNLEIGSTGTLTFEGSTADGFETTLAVTNPTADRTITLPNQSGTVVVSGNASIVDADIAANAEIAVSKLADGAARQLLQTDTAGTGVEWTSNVDIPGTLDVTGAATFDGAVTVAGDLTVNGTTTTISTQNLLVEDKNIIIGDVATPSDTTADGGGITLKGTTDKTINWVDATDAWTSSEHINIASGKEYRIAGTSVLTGTTLGSGITSSSLTSVGTLGSLTVTGANTAGTFIPTSGTAPSNGLYLPAANSVALSTNSNERLRITSAGLVGVGTSSPQAALQVGGTAAASQVRIYGGTAGSTYPELQLYAASSDHNWTIRGNHSINLTIGKGTFGNYGSDLLTLTQGGSVGIGTTSPAGKCVVRVSNNTGAPIAWNSNFLVVSTGDTSTSSGIGFSVDTSDSSASISALTPGTAWLKQYYRANSHTFWYGDAGVTQGMTLDSSGRLLVGTSSARDKFYNTTYTPQLQLEGVTQQQSMLSIVNSVAADGGSVLALGKQRSGTIGGNTILQNGDQIGDISFQGSDGSELVPAASIYAQVDGTPGANDMPGRLVFSTTADGASSPTERMRITSGGTVAIGEAGGPGSRFYATATGSQYAGYFTFVGATGQGIGISSTGAASTNALFFFNNSALVGSVSTTSSSTAYNTSSDYRLKENVTAVTDGITRLQQLKPSRFNFIAEPGKTVDGFIAHEVQAVVPEAITGEKDAVDADGKPIYQGIDQSKLVPLLTAALQEAVAKIESLEARLTAAGI